MKLRFLGNSRKSISYQNAVMTSGSTVEVSPSVAECLLSLYPDEFEIVQKKTPYKEILPKNNKALKKTAKFKSKGA